MPRSSQIGHDRQRIAKRESRVKLQAVGRFGQRPARGRGRGLPIVTARRSRSDSWLARARAVTPDAGQIGEGPGGVLTADFAFATAALTSDDVTV